MIDSRTRERVSELQFELPFGLTDFCSHIKKRYDCLSSVSSSKLAEEYRKKFSLPAVLDDRILRRHAKQLGIRPVQKVRMPVGLAGTNSTYGTCNKVHINLDVWQGVHQLVFFHEVYEIVDRYYASLYKDYRPLRGATLERRADKFASNVVIPNESNVDIVTLINAVPTLSLHLGKQIIPAVFKRVKSRMRGRFPFVFVRFVRSSSERPDDLKAMAVFLDKSPRQTPKRVMRVVRSLLPRYRDPLTKSWLAKQCFDYQGPIVVIKSQGFDLFGRHDLSLVGIPILEDGAISQILCFGFRARGVLGVKQMFSMLSPMVIVREFQVL